MTVIRNTLEKLRERGSAAFIPYITAGDPNLAATERFVKALAGAGADVIELGVPFSDPMADGPTNQRAAERALKAGTSLSKVLATVAKLRRSGVDTPIVLFTYFNPIFAMGVDSFAQAAAKAGVNGALVVDLPPEEAVEYREALGRSGLETIFLSAPTSTAERLRAIDEASTGFVYYVSRTGVTGARKALSETLGGEIARLKAVVKKPVAVGFGISSPEQAARVARLADGVVVGSAIVSLIEKNKDPKKAEARIRTFARSLVRAIRPDRPKRKE